MTLAAGSVERDRIVAAPLLLSGCALAPCFPGAVLGESHLATRQQSGRGLQRAKSTLSGIAIFRIDIATRP